MLPSTEFIDIELKKNTVGNHDEKKTSSKRLNEYCKVVA